MAVSPKEKAVVRSHIKYLLGDIPFVLYVREPPLIDGIRVAGASRTITGADGRKRGMIWLRESYFNDFVALIAPWRKPEPNGYDLVGRAALYLVYHEVAHILQHTVYDDLYEGHFAPHGTHESEQFANALACAYGAGEFWGGYHPPTFEQKALLASYVTHIKGSYCRLSEPRERKTRSMYEVGSPGAERMVLYAADAICVACTD